MFLGVFTCFSQNKKKSKFLPLSIYSVVETVNLNNNYNINKKLNLKSFSFVMINSNDIEDGYFTIPFSDLKNKPSKYIYETYSEIYDNLNLKKSFFKLADLYKVHNNK